MFLAYLFLMWNKTFFSYGQLLFEGKSYDCIYPAEGAPWHKRVL